MTEKWHDQAEESDANGFTDQFWERHRHELEIGHFWADRIKGLRGEPAERLKVAIENLPLPGAFREAAIATRALIRECRKKEQPYGDQLALLYWLAAVSSFSIPYSQKLHEPGYNVMQSVPGGVLKGLNFPYKQLGYKHLELLNKTDVNWLIENWGEPKGHSTLHDLHITVWNKYEDLLNEQREDDNNQRVREMQSLLGTSKVVPRQELPKALTKDKKPTHQNNAKWMGITVAIMVMALILWSAL